MTNQKNNVITLQKVSKSFGKTTVLKNITSTIEQGSTFGLVGLNGAGKTTLIRLLLGLLKPDSGELSVLGKAPFSHNRDLYNNIGVILEHNGFSGNLTLRENVFFYGQAKGLSKKNINEYLDEFWGEGTIGVSSKQVKYFSRGQKMECAVCRAFLGWPKVYFFDEPTLALDMSAYDRFICLIQQGRDRGGTFLISSHQLPLIESLCDTIGILEEGALEIFNSQGVGNTTEEWIIRGESFNNIEEIARAVGAHITPLEKRLCVELQRNSDEIMSSIITQLCAKGSKVFEVYRKNKGVKDIISEYGGSCEN